MERILVIDDDVELCELLQDYLQGEGFNVDCAHDGQNGAEQALVGGYALVVLDVMLPGINGFDVLRKLRPSCSVPVIILTARGEDIDRIVGLELGADDYLAKPFNPRELVARIHAIQRRTGEAVGKAAEEKKLTLYRVGDLVLNAAQRSCKLSGQPIELTSVEYDLLLALVRRAGEVISREELVTEVLGRRHSAYDRSIDVHISALRKKLGPDADQGERIRTVRNVGYLYSQPESDR
jgi:two-component system response regulator CpxR